MWRLIFDMMKLDTYHHFVSDGAEGKLPKWVRVVRFILGLIGCAFLIGGAVFMFKLAITAVAAGAVVLGILSGLFAIVCIAAAIVCVVRGTGKFDGITRDIMDFKYRK